MNADITYIFVKNQYGLRAKVSNNVYLHDLFYSPKTADVNFFNQLNLNTEKAYDVTKNLIIIGDLNKDLLRPNFHNLQNILLVNSLQNTVCEPTRLRALLDLVIISDDLPYLDSGTISVPELVQSQIIKQLI